ncbi:MAG: carboxypeptidase-like regulatory domain-containing protein, partial [Anaerolineae bacterium]|nr:carboxypeptidase-like regulatory domain-containing protein [Anaerolineae bacterium]
MNANYSSKARLGKMAIRGCKWIAAVLLIMACSLVGGTAPVELGAPTLPQSEITFKLSIPQNTPGGALIQINLLDEVTGLPYNKQSMTMQVLDAHHYQVTLRAAVGSVIKYRYTRVFDGLPILEHTPGGQPVRYRMYYVDGPGEVSDIVSRWSDTLPEGGQGRLVGKALDAESGQPVPNLMVTAGGVQVFTAANGEFRIEGLPPGTHQVTGYAVDGSYRPFKQGALVAENAATPVNIQANPAPLVVVRFNVSVPEETVPTVPVRLAGNLVQLGNTFSDWGGGTSTLAGRMPVMEALGGGKYEIQMILTAGTYLRYKYTMGDGFWN